MAKLVAHSYGLEWPLRSTSQLRGVLSKEGAPEWFYAQYEKLPFFCRSCGVLGHSDLVCATPAPRNEEGKLSYDLKLRVDDRRKKPQGFIEAATESFGSASSAGSKQARGSSKRSDDISMGELGEGTQKETEDDATSPIKDVPPNGKGMLQKGTS